MPNTHDDRYRFRRLVERLIGRQEFENGPAQTT